MGCDDRIVDLTVHRQSLRRTDREVLEAYWREIGGASDIPHRQHIDPARISDCLGQVMVLERIAPRQAKIRLAGQSVGQALGLEPQGMPLGCLIALSSRALLGEVVERLFDGPARVELDLAGPRTTFRRRLEGSVLLLPLRDRTGEITRAIAHVTLPERRTTAPIRFDITDWRHARLNARPVAPQPVQPDFEAADRAREVLRRRQSFRIVDPA
jgi:hypothetical protein